MIVLLLSLLLAVGCTSGGAPDGSQGDGIIFLHLELTETSATLLEQSLAPGRLKSLRSAPDRPGLHIELQGAGGEVLWRGFTEDPFTLGFEHADPTGTLGRHAVSRTEAEIVIRVPQMAAGRSVALFLVTPDRTDRQMVGRIDLQ